MGVLRPGRGHATGGALMGKQQVEAKAHSGRPARPCGMWSPTRPAGRAGARGDRRLHRAEPGGRRRARGASADVRVKRTSDAADQRRTRRRARRPSARSSRPSIRRYSGSTRPRPPRSRARVSPVRVPRDVERHGHSEAPDEIQDRRRDQVGAIRAVPAGERDNAHRQAHDARPEQRRHEPGVDHGDVDLLHARIPSGAGILPSAAMMNVEKARSSGHQAGPERRYNGEDEERVRHWRARSVSRDH